jgi:hypothetical protein
LRFSYVKELLFPLEALLLQEAEIYYPPKVLFITDDPGIFYPAIVDIQHIDIESMFVIRQVYGVAGAGSSAFVEAEFWIV